VKIQEIIFGKDVEIIENGYGGLVYVFLTKIPLNKFEINIHYHKGDFHSKD